MKYLIKNLVINGDQIRQVRYMTAAETISGESKCVIDTGTGGVGIEVDWDITLHDREADRFWDAYSGDAYAVV